MPFAVKEDFRTPRTFTVVSLRMATSARGHGMRMWCVHAANRLAISITMA